MPNDCPFGAGHIYLVGRKKAMINRGGEKISPFEVEEAVVAHPDVADCVAFAAPHELLGEGVGMLLVPVKGRTALVLGALRSWLRERGQLAPPKWPEVVVVRDATLKTPSGKPRRIGVATELGVRPIAADKVEVVVDSQFSGSRKALLRRNTSKIIKIDESKLKDDDDLFHAGLNSVTAAQLAAATGLPTAAVYQYRTLRQLEGRMEAGAVESKKSDGAKLPPWVIKIREAQLNAADARANAAACGLPGDGSEPFWIVPDWISPAWFTSTRLATELKTKRAIFAL